MEITTELVARQLWNLPTSTPPASIPHCTAFTLPVSGVIVLPETTLTLSSDAVFMPQCTGADYIAGIDGSPNSIKDLLDPFYASVTPQVYVIAATTVIAWILVIMLIITPRTSFMGASAAQPAFTQGQGLIGGANGGSTSLVGVGSRPWLQKVAALTVAISLSIATADTFQVAQDQYYTGYMDATAMREQVIGSLEIRVTRVISDVFVWLAQVQTLIRLFPRHKEKVLIKWIGFVLIICDSTFSCLNAFLVNSQRAPRYFVDAIPALSYLFELALGLLYAAWVMYYSATKRRYAFYHKKMKSISLIALLSLVAVLTPVVFFVTDVSNSDVAGWGDYFRWVGAAAASVVVWEWVERIEAVERDEKKDGILGREVFDGDEMLDGSPGNDLVWSSGRRTRARMRRFRRGGGDGGQRESLESGSSAMGSGMKHTSSLAYTSSGRDWGQTSATTAVSTNGTSPSRSQNSNNALGAFSARDPKLQQTASTGITPPPQVASPVSRTDTSSAASTIYVVRSEPAAEVPRPIRRRVDQRKIAMQGNATQRAQQQQQAVADEDEKLAAVAAERGDNGTEVGTKWYNVANPFKRKRASPPAEVQKAQRDAASTDGPQRAATPGQPLGRWDFQNRFGALATGAGDALREKVGRRPANTKEKEEEKLIVIPAQPRGSGRTWSPAVLETSQAASGQQSTSIDQQQDGEGSAEASQTGAASSTFDSLSGTTNVGSPTMIRAGQEGDRMSPANPSTHPSRD